MHKNSKHYHDWLQKAENDLMASKAIVAFYEKPPTDTICYHCHQVAEKSLKAYLVFTGVMFHKIHDLIVLLNLCLSKDKTLDSLRDDLEILNQYYIETKYPPDMPLDYSKDESQEAINKAERIYNTIKSKVK